MSGTRDIGRKLWRPQPHFAHAIETGDQLDGLNRSGGLAVEFQSQSKDGPGLFVEGTQTTALSLWTTRTTRGFKTTPLFAADLITVRFVVKGHLIRRNWSKAHVAFPNLGMIVDFNSMRSEVASEDFESFGGTVRINAIASGYRNLHGYDQELIPEFEPVAPVTTLPMQALMKSFQTLNRRLTSQNFADDIFMPILEEVLVYNIITAWPARHPVGSRIDEGNNSSQVRRAVDFIQEHLARPIKLADIADAIGVTVRTLQTIFRKELATTPVQYIMQQRLKEVHKELISTSPEEVSVASVAKKWGFLHLSDFSQRYKTRFGHSPSARRK